MKSLPASPETSATLRTLGNAARDRANWPAAAYYYARLLELEPDDAMLWLQQGHMLKESGLQAEARASYLKALALRPDDPEIHLQLAILAKLAGSFDDAMTHYREAEALGHPSTEFIASETAFIRRTAGISLLVSTAGTTGTRILLSSVAQLPSETDSGSLKSFLGGTHYSYAYAMMGFRDALQRAGYDCEIILNPQYVADIRQGSPAKTHLHLGFYPPDGPRYLKGATNIMCVAWEFERLKTPEETLSYHAFADPVAMLARSQEIWMTSEYGAEAFRRSGLTGVMTVSTPVAAARERGRPGRPSLTELQRAAIRLDRISWIPLAIWPAMQTTLSQHAIGRSRALLSLLLEVEEEQAPTLFISVFNVHDFRKQIKPLIHAFTRYASENRNAYLLLKISCIDGTNETINGILFAAQIKDDGEVATPLVCENILMTTEPFSRDEMNLFYDMASFYVCTSYAEGQNLPLLEAMGHGIVPISVAHTAMSDYISPDNSVIVPSTRAPMTTRLVQRYGMFGVETYHIESKDVYQSLCEASQLTEQQYVARSDMAVRTVIEKFGVAPFRQAVEHAVERSRHQAVSGLV